MKTALRLGLAVCLTLAFAVSALAAPRSYIVLPFQVTAPQGYMYLQKAIPSSLSSRLLWQGQIQPTTGKAASSVPASEADVKAVQHALNADYAVWGSINVVGNDATLNVQVRDKTGKTWKRSTNVPVNALMGAVQGTADSISRDIFKRPMPKPVQHTSAQNGGSQPINQMNPAIVVNETNQGQVYLNPQFRYQGAGSEDGSRLRSRTLPFAMVDFAVGDFDGDGKNEVAVLSDHKLYIFAWDNGKLKQLVEHTTSMSNQNFILRGIDLNRDRAQELVVVTFDESDNHPYSYIYSFRGGKLGEYCKRSDMFLNVVKLAPTFTPTLVCQKWDSVKLFRPGVYLASVTGDRSTASTRLDLPKGANVFNFAWLPGTKGDTDKLIVMNDQERLKVFSTKGNEIHLTMDRYSGSSVGMEHYKAIDGLGVDKNYQLPDKYFAPMRLVTADLENRGEWVVMINKPISTAAEFFQRYRFYPQGEIHALYWDGVGLGLKWKTRRIKGSVTDLDIADINNDGIPDLIVGLNTHPGAVGLSQRRCLITAYPLDLGMTNPNTAPDMTEFEESK